MKTLLAILFGGVVGVAATLIFAPRSGEETRAKIRGKVFELRDNTTETVSNQASQARSKANELRENAQAKAAELHDKIAEAL